MANLKKQLFQSVEQAVAHEQGRGKEARERIIRVKPLLTFDYRRIKKLRKRLGMTQVVFSSVIGVNKKTVEAWEAGRNLPSGAASRVLELLEKDNQLVERFELVSRGGS